MEGPSVGAAPGHFIAAVCDVSKEAEVNALPALIQKHWPGAGVDVLVNNAGVLQGVRVGGCACACVCAGVCVGALS
jgi:NAD(P)-dependent dehydrogenase (short-subunit alcohol dehydrogenase family)